MRNWLRRGGVPTSGCAPGSTYYFADVRLPKVDERLGDLARTHRYVMAASVLTEYHRKA